MYLLVVGKRVVRACVRLPFGQYNVEPLLLLSSYMIEFEGIG